ncbi:UNVERIFIED_ORG: hypothetical protein LHJ69_05010 [Shinella sp. XGS7]|nr:ATP-binding protein [Shinella sp. XGS7]
MSVPAPPASPRAAVLVGESLASRLERAWQWLAQSRWAEALALLEAEPEPGAQVGEMLLRELYRLRARSTLATQPGDVEAAQRLLVEAQGLQQPALEAEARQTLAGVLSRLHLFREALREYGQAEALVRRSGQMEPLWPVLSGIARVLYDAEMHVERIAHCERVLREHPEAPLALRLSMLNMQATAHKWLGEQQRARELYLQTLALAETGDEPLLPLVVLDNLANSCAWTGHIEEGWAYLRRSEALMAGTEWGDDRRLWHEQARALLVWKGGDAAAALPIFETVVRLGRGRVQLRTGLITGLTRLAEAARDAGELARALTAQQELVQLAEQRAREQASIQAASVAALVQMARLEADKQAAEQQRAQLENRVGERTAELSRALARLQAEVEMRRATEAALQRAHDELEQRVQQRSAELEQALQALMQREKLAALGHLVAGVAHELNTPIGNARLAASVISAQSRSLRQLLQEPAPRRAPLRDCSVAVDEGAQLVERALERASSLLQRFKTVALPAETGAVQELDLVRRLSDLVALLRAGNERGPQWRLDLPERLLVRLDAEALVQLVSLLLDNARVHGAGERPEAWIALRLRAWEREGRPWLSLEVSDDGPGIAAAHLERVFDPFFTTRLGQGGSGLGLYRAHALAVDTLGGELLVRSPPGQGACFELRLPRWA